MRRDLSRPGLESWAFLERSAGGAPQLMQIYRRD
jgi:hypothetical protein